MNILKNTLVALTTCFILASCTKENVDGSKIVGQWMSDNDPEFITTFNDDNSYTDSEGGKGAWQYKNGMLTIANDYNPFPLVYDITSLTDEYMYLNILGEDESFTKVGCEHSLKKRIVGKWQFVKEVWYDEYDDEENLDSEPWGYIIDSDGTLHEYEGNESYVYGTWRIEEHSFIVSDEGEDEGSSYIILLTDKKLRMTSYPDEGYAEFRKVK